VAERAEVFLFLVFELEGVVTDAGLGQQPEHHHQVLAHVEKLGVGLDKWGTTWGGIYLWMTALRNTLRWLSTSTVY